MAQSAAALDRQIRPIYDALDTGSNKSAIQACNKLLKKHPNLELVKALKALAVVRTNKIEETLPLCDEVLAAKPTDLDTLTAMMHVLRALGRHSDMVTMFDEAYKKLPTNEELGAQSFFSNVRTGNWKAAQQIATKMHRQFKSDRYLYWSVISAVLQAHDARTPPQTRTILFKLAHRLLASATQPPHSSADRMHLHLTVLRELELYDDALALLASEEGAGVVKTSLVVEEVRREIVRLQGMWVMEGEQATRKLVEEKDRNWLEFLSVLDATFSYVTAPGATTDGTTEISAEDKSKCTEHVKATREMFTKLAEEDGRKDRGALLALVELEWRARQHGVSSEEGALVSLLKRYFETFGDKACCFEDLKPYNQLEGTDRDRWSEFLTAHDHSSATPLDLQRSINVHKLQRNALAADELTVEHESSRALIYLKQYIAALSLGKSLLATDLQPADDLVILAGQVLVSLWKRSGDEAYLHNAAAALEFASARSKQSYIIHLQLIRIYRLLGAPTLAWQHYHDMNVKQFQNDTLSHFVLARASTFSLASSGDLTFPQECLESSQIYVSNSSETADFIVRAFAAEKYSQIPDFITFEDRLDNSLQRDLVKIEHVRMRLTHEAIVPDIVDAELIELKFIFDRLHHDNRDFDVLPNYQPRVQQSFNEQTLMLGSSPGLGWLMTYLRIYIRVFQQSSDLDDSVEEKLLIGDRPKVSDSPESKMPLKDRLPTRKQEELEELTSEELSLFEYAMAMCDWLGPYHDHARPPPPVVLAEATKHLEAKSGKAKTVQQASNGASSTNGHGKKAEEPPAVTDAPAIVVQYFDNMAARFREVANEKHLPWEALHVATITQEALVLFTIVTLRFKSPSVVKVNKLGALTQIFKELRIKALATLKDMSTELVKLGEREGTSERRKAFVESCKLIQTYPEFEHDYIMSVAKKVTDARKRVLEGVGKGATRLVQNLP